MTVVLAVILSKKQEVPGTTTTARADFSICEAGG